MLWAIHAFSQEAVYKCGHEYTNDEHRAKIEKCKLLVNGPVVTLSAPARQRSVETAKSSKPIPKKNIDIGQQARDSDAHTIIMSELKKTEAQLADLHKQYDAQGIATSSDMDRKATLKQQIARAEADIMSLKRELKR